MKVILSSTDAQIQNRSYVFPVQLDFVPDTTVSLSDYFIFNDWINLFTGSNQLRVRVGSAESTLIFEEGYYNTSDLFDALILKLNGLIEPQYQAVYSFKKKVLPTQILISIESDDTAVAPVYFFEGDPFFVLDFTSRYTTIDSQRLGFTSNGIFSSVRWNFRTPDNPSLPVYNTISSHEIPRHFDSQVIYFDFAEFPEQAVVSSNNAGATMTYYALVDKPKKTLLQKSSLIDQSIKIKQRKYTNRLTLTIRNQQNQVVTPSNPFTIILDISEPVALPQIR